MKKNMIKLFSFVALVSAGFTGGAVHAYDVINGNACVAANLNQAFELQWNQARVLNPATNPNTRFVTCTISTGPKYMDMDPSLQITSVESGGVEAYFHADASGSAEAACIFREMSSGSTGNAGADTSVVTVVNGDAAAANTARGSFSSGAGLSFGINIGIGGSASTTRTYTMTCALDPGVGINAYWANQTLPSS
ncbi:hypothetical protein [Arenicella xantha]|nr:hypothetical protein [Arenicella xantha]